MDGGTEADPELLARYRDWCAGQINRRMLQLTPDEIWELANRSATNVGAEAEIDAILRGGDASEALSTEYLELVRRAAIAIAQDLELPALDEWSERYAWNPEDFERDMMDLGESRLEEPL